MHHARATETCLGHDHMRALSAPLCALELSAPLCALEVMRDPCLTLPHAFEHAVWTGMPFSLVCVNLFLACCLWLGPWHVESHVVHAGRGA